MSSAMMTVDMITPINLPKDCQAMITIEGITTLRILARNDAIFTISGHFDL